MRLDANLIRYLSPVEWRVLTAVEMGMKNHEVVPAPLIAKIANIRRSGITQIISTLLKNKLLAHEGQSYDGYKLTYLGYDFLALRAFAARGLITGVGRRIGVGKESDIHLCESPEGKLIILKLHRLGRISFRTIKKNRDYLGKRQHASWIYMARLAAAKEFSYMQALHKEGFPVPEAIDVNRHAILMSYIEGYPMSQVKELRHPKRVLEGLMQLIVRLSEAGVVHGDFNEFNLIITDDELVTLIDFPQIVSIDHPNAEDYFSRDVNCIRNLFSTKFGMEVVKFPLFADLDLPSSPLLDEASLEDKLALEESSLECEKAEIIELKSDNDSSVPLVDSLNENSSRSDNSDLASDSDEESVCSQSKAPKRLDNVWKPSVKRITTSTAKEKAQDIARRRKTKGAKGNYGTKKNRESRKNVEAIRETIAF